MLPNIKKISPFLTLKTVYTDKFKTERISVTVENKPYARRTPVEKFVFSVLKRGSGNYPTQQALNRRLDELYSTSVSPFFMSGGGRYKIGFCAEFLGEDYVDGKVFEGALELLFDMFWNPRLDSQGRFLEEYVESQRENICDSIRSIINDPRLYALKRFWEIMYAGDDYSIPSNGTVELINSVTVDELMTVYSDLVRNSSYEVFYVGSKSADEIELAVKKIFDRYNYGASKAVNNPVSFEVDTKKVKRVNETMQLSQGKLVMGFKTGVNITCGKDFYATLVMNEIFGASPVSKLFMNVRERLGLCYHCSSRLDPHKGCIYVYSGIDKSELKKTEREILKQLDCIKKGMISEAEFSAAKKSLVSSYTETNDSAAAIERFYIQRSEYGITDTVEDVKRQISEITLDDVLSAASKVKLDTVYFLCGNDKEEASGLDD